MMLSGIGDPYKPKTQYTVHAWPDSYVPRKPRPAEIVGEMWRELRTNWKFWTVASLMTGYVLYHIVKFAVNQPWAMRIN